MKRKRDKGKNVVRDIAYSRILILFELAEGEFDSHPERSKRYVELARKIGMRNKVTLSSELKRKFCKKCGAYLKEGVNSSIEKGEGFSVVNCKKCGSARKSRD